MFLKISLQARFFCWNISRSDKYLPNRKQHTVLRSQRPCQTLFATRWYSRQSPYEIYHKYSSSYLRWSHDSEETHPGLHTTRLATVYTPFETAPSRLPWWSLFLPWNNPLHCEGRVTLDRQLEVSLVLCYPSPLSVKSEPQWRAWLTETLYFLMTREQRLSQCDLTVLHKSRPLRFKLLWGVSTNPREEY